MKKYLLFLLLALIYWNCGSSIDTTNLGPNERVDYAIKLYNDGDYEMAIKELEAILLQFPGNEIADQAQFYLGQAHFKKKEYILAGYEYSKLIKTMTASKYIVDAQYMLASCYYELAPPYPLDQKYTKKAIEELQAFIDIFPADPRVSESENRITELQTRMAEKEFHDAYIYERMEYYNAAIMTYGKVTETYHDSKFAPMASYKKIQLLIQKNRFSEASNEIESFLLKYPQDERIKDVQALKTDVSKQATQTK
jgi:outer membrane protein assembly factor BamD